MGPLTYPSCYAARIYFFSFLCYLLIVLLQKNLRTALLNTHVQQQQPCKDGKGLEKGQNTGPAFNLTVATTLPKYGGLYITCNNCFYYFSH